MGVAEMREDVCVVSALRAAGRRARHALEQGREDVILNFQNQGMSTRPGTKIESEPYCTTRRAQMVLAIPTVTVNSGFSSYLSSDRPASPPRCLYLCICPNRLCLSLSLPISVRVIL